MAHPNSLRNLRAPWKPGEVPNPKGINRKRPYTDRLFETAEALLPQELRVKINDALQRQFGKKDMLPPDTTYADAQALRLHLDAIMGDIQAAQFIADRVEGKPPNRLDLIGHERQEITIRVVEDEPGGCYSKDVGPRRVEKVLLQYIVLVMEKSPESEDEKFLTKLADLGMMIKQRAKARGQTIDVSAR